VVSFGVPGGWVIERPNVNFNGTSGTLAANDFFKGDTATFWVDTSFKGKLDEMKKGQFLKEMRLALTQKGASFVDSLKVKKVRDGAPGYRICEIEYELASPSDFAILRTGLASFTQATDSENIQVLWSATITSRWDQKKDDIKYLVESFRASPVPKSIKTNTYQDIGLDGMPLNN